MPESVVIETAQGEYWAGVIRERWQDSVQAIIDVGKLLTDAKEAMQLDTDGWKEWCDQELPFGWQASYQLIAIAKDPRFSNTLEKLPSSWGTLYELTKLDNKQWEKAVKENKIRPDMQRKEVKMIHGKKDVIQFSGEYEWYTPPEHIERARKVMGSIDLDPASSDEANKTVEAEYYYTLENSGLDDSNEWWGNVFCNPPYCMPEIADYCDRMNAEYEHGSINQGILLTNNSSDTEWWQGTLEACGIACLTNGRISFINGGASSTPLRGQTFFYFGPNKKRFHKVFQEVGIIVTPYAEE